MLFVKCFNGFVCCNLLPLHKITETVGLSVFVHFEFVFDFVSWWLTLYKSISFHHWSYKTLNFSISWNLYLSFVYSFDRKISLHFIDKLFHIQFLSDEKIHFHQQEFYHLLNHMIISHKNLYFISWRVLYH